MTNFIISFGLAYLMLGLSQVTEDLTADPLSKPMWAIRPTFGKMLLVGITWVARPFVDAVHSQHVGRSIAFAVPKAILPLVILTAFTWVCIIATAHWFDSLALRVLSVAVLVIVGGRLLLPWISLVLTAIVMLPIAWFFSSSENDEAK